MPRRMAVALWRQRRLVAAETAQLQLQQAELTAPELVRIRHITGVKDIDWINALAREPLPDLVDLQADVAACDAWMVEDHTGDDVQDLATLPKRKPRVWAMLSNELEVDTPDQASEKILGDSAEGLHAWVESVRGQASELLKVATALKQVRQSALQPRESDVLSRYQSSLDNDLYKAMRARREAQRHRLEQAALTAKPIGPLESEA